MRKLKLLALAALALFAFGAVAARTAFAVDENTPQLLVLAGEAKELKGTLKGGGFRVEDLAKKTIEGTGAEVKLEKCKNEAASVKDTTLCAENVITLSGFKKEKVSCRSTNLKGEKDPIGTILGLLNVHLGAGLNLPVSDELVPILTAQILNTDKDAQLEIVCGVVEVRAEGVIACAAGPGLTNTSKLEVLCKINEKTADPEMVDCTVLCEAIGKIGLKTTFGEKPEDAWESIHLEGELNKDLFIDD